MIPDEDVDKIMTQMLEGQEKPRPKYSFEKGDSVHVVDGPFINFNGTVEEVRPDKGKLRVLVSIFRQTDTCGTGFYSGDEELKLRIRRVPSGVFEFPLLGETEWQKK